jgi:hypothetical protein
MKFAKRRFHKFQIDDMTDNPLALLDLAGMLTHGFIGRTEN